MEKRSELRMVLIRVGLPETSDHQGACEVWLMHVGKRRLPPTTCEAPEASVSMQLLDFSWNPQTFTVSSGCPMLPTCGHMLREQTG